LRYFPHAGWLVEELDNPDILEILFESHRILYRIIDSTVLIVRVFHGARRLRAGDVLKVN
jgi:plasmid stabilization system protein ParE